MIEKRTLLIGASSKPNRFSNIAIRNLVMHNHPVIAIGLREGEAHGVRILKPFPEVKDIHTVTMYIGPQNQPAYYDYILQVNPRRVIFNPGTENDELEKMLRESAVEVIEGCTLIMLSNGTY